MQPMQPMQPMSPVSPAAPVRKVSAFRVGLIFGVIVAIILIAIGVVERLIPGAPGITLGLGAVSIIVSLVAYFFAGFRASSRSGKVSTGLLAGMWTGLISSFLNAIIAVILAIPNLPEAARQANSILDQSGQQISFRYDETSVLAVLIGTHIVLILLAGIVGLGVGAIGGAAGKGRAPLSQQQYQESLYQSPMGGYPPQPGYPSYPQQQPPQQGGYPGYPPQQPPGYPPQQ